MIVGNILVHISIKDTQETPTAWRGGCGGGGKEGNSHPQSNTTKSNVCIPSAEESTFGWLLSEIPKASERLLLFTTEDI